LYPVTNEISSSAIRFFGSIIASWRTFPSSGWDDLVLLDQLRGDGADDGVRHVLEDVVGGVRDVNAWASVSPSVSSST